LNYTRMYYRHAAKYILA